MTGVTSTDFARLLDSDDDAPVGGYPSGLASHSGAS
jgi:hypothetical protein